MGDEEPDVNVEDRGGLRDVGPALEGRGGILLVFVEEIGHSFFTNWLKLSLSGRLRHNVKCGAMCSAILRTFWSQYPS